VVNLDRNDLANLMSTTVKDVQFQLVGGHVCLDFANTLEDRGAPTENDLLSNYVRLLQFAKQSRVFSDDELQRIERAVQHFPMAAELAPAHAIRVREVIYEIFSAVANDRPVPEPALATFNSFVNDAARNRTLVVQDNSFRWRWRDTGSDLVCLVWPFAWEAANLLASDDLKFVRECASPTCSWLFLDKSKSHSRRWCDMKVCGNRSKARKFYQRSKAQG
jgi:predicted RNA-binding Zn ribbon-like protein